MRYSESAEKFARACNLVPGFAEQGLRSANAGE